ncbi:MAG: hypothetical protein J6Q22_10855 [Prevotella sp.]|nr:hypothetical protein [Prevotella sp.]
MEPSKFIEPKRIKIGDNQFVISKIPAIQAQQVYGAIMRECKDDGDVAMTYLSAETGLLLLGYAAFDRDEDGKDENLVVLNTNEAINAYCHDVTTLINLEAAMIRYNFGFLFDGSLQKVLGVLRDEETL